MDTSQSEALNMDGEEELTRLKELVTGERLSGQRDITILMADTPSPAASIISIHSELSEGEEREDDPLHT